MKRFLSAIICIVLILGIYVPATAAEDKDGFVLRNGIRWGMSKDEVIASLNADEVVQDWDMNDKDAIAIPGLTVASISSLGLVCAFEENKLCLAMYDFEDTQPLQHLRWALCAVYGDPSDDLEEKSYHELYFWGMIYETLEVIESVSEFELFDWWKLLDGTQIVLAEIEGELIIAYFHPDYISVKVDTDGL